MKAVSVVFAVAATLCACAPAMEDFGEPGSLPDKKAQDYAACKLRAQEVSRGESAIWIGDLYNAALKDCMKSKGYAVN